MRIFNLLGSLRQRWALPGVGSPFPFLIGVWLFVCCFGCAPDATDEVQLASPDPAYPPYASEVVSVIYGEGAGYGLEAMPDVVLGAPGEGSTWSASLDVVSLGVGGEIVLGFGQRYIVDGPGVDFLVFENPFWPGGEPSAVWKELAEVSVSEDGEDWRSFGCDSSARAALDWEGCAGWSPTLRYDRETTLELSWEAVGGDGFDLADLGMDSVRFVRIVDLSESGQAPSAGFDLDAVGLVNWTW